LWRERVTGHPVSDAVLVLAGLVWVITAVVAMFYYVLDAVGGARNT
jgi:hypothetical protein